eukprot:TRINITY_DN1947_c0_g1_i1.p2 TRINITY_DN1947_c0_g1~~TRINITY_DN1947_c0_g1_i1.p2  ORF type:complete len:397 (-),score=155.91 TRINITY_DN1947_c0_g1_i1:69-1259(-)
MAIGGFTSYQVFLAVLFLITGSINTISVELADQETAIGSDGTLRAFDHPFFQAVWMFLGEMTCLVAFLIISRMVFCQGLARILKVNNITVPQDLSIQDEKPVDSGKQYVSPFIFLPPALCDMTGTSLTYVALNLTTAASAQMLRSSVIVFTGITSFIFFGRKGTIPQWLGIFIIVIGLTVVGLNDFLDPSSSTTASNPILGDMIVIGAQLIVAIQMMLEEHYVVGRGVHPLAAVGWEGWFGFFILGLLLIPMYFIKVGSTFSTSPDGRLEDALDAFTQMGNNPMIILWTLLNLGSISFYNFAGVSVTQELNATTRTVLDTLRTFVIWAFSLAIGWQTFSYLQVIGFVILFAGIFVYNDILFFPLLRKYEMLPKFLDVKANQVKEEEQEPILNYESD